MIAKGYLPTLMFLAACLAGRNSFFSPYISYGNPKGFPIRSFALKDPNLPRLTVLKKAERSIIDIDAT